MVLLSSLDQYGSDFQIKVISSLLTHKEFLINIYDVLDENDFNNIAHQWIINKILDYFDKYHAPPTMEVLKIELQKLENEVLRLSIKEQLREAYIASEQDLKYVKDEFSSFCKNQQLKKALLNSVNLLKNNDFDSIRSLIENALKAGQDKNIGHEYNKDTESRYRENSRNCIPTPWSQINELLQGGLGKGDFGLIYGNPGGGKSWALVALGGFASKLGYNVAHYTLELGEEYIGLRYDSFFTQIPVNGILSHRDRVEDMISQLKGKVIIKEFDRATVSTIEAHQKKLKDLGFESDLIVIDYCDLLITKKKTSDRKGEIDDIYLNIKRLAKRLNIPIWSVSQVNRAGARDDVVEGDRSAGSYDKVMIVDFSCSLSRKRKDKVEGTGRWHVMKNRYGEDGMTFNMKINTNIGHFEIVSEYNEEENDQNNNSPKPQSQFIGNNIDEYDKEALKKKFFELNT
jgi:replicative DNA helicase